MKTPATALLRCLSLGCVSLCALVACGSEAIIIEPPPDLPEGGAVILAIGSEGGGFELTASPSNARRFLAQAIERDEPVQITAFVYAQSLSALGLEPGVIPEVASELCGARGLPSQDSLHHLSIEDGEASGWRALDARPAALGALRIAGPCPCDAFDVLDRPTTPPFVAWFDQAERVLLMDADRAFWTLDRSDNLTKISTATLAPSGDIQGVFEGVGQEIWLAVDGVVWRGGPIAGFEPVATLTGDELRIIAGGPGPDGFELYGATTGGNLVQIAPGEPKVLVTAVRVPTNPSQLGRVVWLAPGEVAAAEHNTFDIFWVKDGVETRRIQLPQDSGGARRLQLIPQVGLLVLTTNTRVLRIDGPNIVDYEDAPVLPNARFLLPYKEGFAYVGDTGFIQQFVPGFGFCPTQFIEGQVPIFGMSWFDDRVVAYTLSPTGRGGDVVLLQPRPLQP